MTLTKQKDLLNGPLLPKILLFTLPIILSSLLQLLFNAADLVVVGKFDQTDGSSAQAAISATVSLIHLIINLFVGFSVGVNVVIARLCGSKDTKNLKSAVQTSVFISLVAGIAVGIIGAVLSKPMLVLMGTDSSILPLSSDYLRIYFLGAPFMIIYNAGSAIMRAYGDTSRPMIYLTISGVVNVGLNLLLVIKFNLGVTGVAIATSVSNILSCALIILALIRDKGIIRLDLKEIKIKKDIAKQILIIGVPSGIQTALFSLSNVFIQSSVNLFSPATVAGNGDAGNIEGFIYVISNGFTQATITFTGQSIGAKRYNLIGKIARIVVMLTVITGVVAGLGSYIFSKPLMSIYSSDPEVIKAGAERMAVTMPLYVVCGLMDVMSGMNRGMGRSIEPMIIMLVGVAGIRILWIFTVFRRYKSLRVLFMSYPLTWLITFIALTVCFIINKRKLIVRNAEETNL